MWPRRARYYGASCTCYYKWLHWYEADGLDGLRDRSIRLLRIPTAIDSSAVEKTLWVRSTTSDLPTSRCTCTATTRLDHKSRTPRLNGKVCEDLSRRCTGPV